MGSYLTLLICRAGCEVPETTQSRLLAIDRERGLIDRERGFMRTKKSHATGTLVSKSFAEEPSTDTRFDETTA